jgi:hypothetical protein
MTQSGHTCGTTEREGPSWKNFKFVGAAIAFFAAGTLMVLYENFRIRAGRPILKGSAAVQLYYVSYAADYPGFCSVV